MTTYDGVLLRNEGPPDFASNINRLFSTIGWLALAASTISIAGLAWWARSILVSIIFGAFGLLATVSILITVGDWTHPPPNWLFHGLADWLQTTIGPLGAQIYLSSALAVSGAIGLYRWWTTRLTPLS